MVIVVIVLPGLVFAVVVAFLDSVVFVIVVVSKRKRRPSVACKE